MELKAICLNIAKERIKKGLSAYELSLRIDKNASYISKLECGNVNATLKVILEIANVLEIPPKTLFEE